MRTTYNKKLILFIIYTEIDYWKQFLNVALKTNLKEDSLSNVETSSTNKT